MYYNDIVRCSWNVVFWMDVNGEQIEREKKKKTKGSNRDGTFYLRSVWPE